MRIDSPVSTMRTPALIATALAIIGLSLSYLRNGSALLSPDKDIVLAALEGDRWFVLGEVCTLLAVVLAYVARSVPISVVTWTLTAVITYMGFRTSMVLAVLSVFYVRLAAAPAHRLLLSHWRTGIFGICFAMFAFSYKLLFSAIKAADWSGVVRTVSSPTFLERAVSDSEPFTTQAILNEVLRQHFSISGDHLLGVLLQFTLFAPELNLNFQTFNQQFQPVLFPYVQCGLAGNPWAEAYALGQWFAVIIAAYIFAASLSLGHRLTLLARPLVRTSFAVGLTYWAFYFHRNELSYQLNLEKRVLLVALTIGALAALVRLVGQPRHSLP